MQKFKISAADDVDMLAVTPEQDAFKQAVYEENLKNRVIIINEEINDYTVERVGFQIQKFNREDKHKELSERKPIVLQINCDGGDVMVGLPLVNIIQNSKTPVWGVCMKSCSMAAFVLAACHKRYAYEGSTVLLHDGSTSVYGSSSKVEDLVNYSNNLWSKLEEIILNNTKITKEKYDAKRRDEWYMLGDEAKEYGIVDFLIGKDVDMDEIL